MADQNPKHVGVSSDFSYITSRSNAGKGRMTMYVSTFLYDSNSHQLFISIQLVDNGPRMYDTKLFKRVS